MTMACSNDLGISDDMFAEFDPFELMVCFRLHAAASHSAPINLFASVAGRLGAIETVGQERGEPCPREKCPLLNARTRLSALLAVRRRSISGAASQKSNCK